MLDKTTASYSMGCDYIRPTLLGVVLSSGRSGPNLDEFFEFPAGSAEGQDPSFSNDQRKRLEKLQDFNLVVTALPTTDVLVRSLEVPLKKIKDIDAVLPFQSEPLLPFSIENAILDRIILEQNDTGTLLTVIASKKERLQEHIDQWKHLGVEPEVITCVPAALVEFSKMFRGGTDPLLILHLGSLSATCVVADNGKLIAAQGVSSGMNSLIASLALDKSTGDAAANLEFLKMNFNVPFQETYPHFSDTLSVLKQEFSRIFYALSKQLKGKDVRELLITGEGAQSQEFCLLLCRYLNKTLVELKSVPGIALNGPELLKNSIAVGAALSGLPDIPDQINFRQGEFAYPNPWKRVKQPLIVYFGLCLFVAFSLYILGGAYTAYHEARLKQEYLGLLNLMNKPYSIFENDFASKNHVAPSAVSDLTQEELSQRLQYLDKEIQATPQIYPLLPSVPLVSDVLTWLSLHPIFSGSSEGSELLRLESFSYTLVKRPEISKKQEKYQVKVEIEFSSSSPKRAREFHDALVAPNEIIDPKGEIKWTSNRDKYRASFFLKDKTIYP